MRPANQPKGRQPALPWSPGTEEQAFDGVKGVLQLVRLSFHEVIDITSFHVGLQASMRKFMEVKGRFVSEPYPAWTAIGISELAVPGGLVEIKVIARMRGAGLYTFAYRQPQWARELTIYEVDHPYHAAMGHARRRASGARH